MITSETIRGLIGEVVIGFDAAAMTDEQTFRDAGIDSLDHINILLALEEGHGVSIPDAEVKRCNSIAAILAFAALQPA